MRADDNIMKDPKSLENKSRRKAVKTIAGGVTALAAYHVLPSTWSKPIIEQVFLPAHAQTSGCVECSLEDPCTITVLDGHQFSSEVVVQVDGYVTPPTSGLPVTIELTPLAITKAPLSDPATYQTVTDGEGKFTGTFTITGGPGIEEVSAVTRVDGADGQAQCSASSHVETPKKNPCTLVTFIHAPFVIRRQRGVRLQGISCPDNESFSERIYHEGTTSISISFDRVNPEVLSRVGNNDVVAELVYRNGTSTTVNCRNQTTLSLTNVVTVTFTPSSAVP